MGQARRKTGETKAIIGWLVLAAIATLGTAQPSFADFALAKFTQYGTLDRAFDGDGLRTDTPTPGDASASSWDSMAWDVKRDSAGRLIVGGMIYPERWSDEPTSRFVVRRYFANGGLDTTFGIGGQANAQFTELSSITQHQWAGMALDPRTGKIVLAATVHTGGCRLFGVIRLNANGVLDTSFDGDGKKLLGSTTCSRDYVAAGVAVDSSSRIVIAATSYRPSNVTSGSVSELVVVRMLASGAPDFTFDADGAAVKSFSTDTSASGLWIEAGTGRIVVAGSIAISSSRQDLQVVRFTSKGTLDTSFDYDGVRTISFPVSGYSSHAKVGGLWVDDATGYVFLSGGAYSTAGDRMILAGLRSGGQLDTSFDGDGRVYTDVPGLVPDGHTNLVVDVATGRITTVGHAEDSEKFDRRVVVARYSLNGALNPSFSGDGLAVGNFRYYDVNADPFGAPDDWFHGILYDRSTGGVLIAGMTF